MPESLLAESTATTIVQPSADIIPLHPSNIASLIGAAHAHVPASSVELFFFDKEGRQTALGTVPTDDGGKIAAAVREAEKAAGGHVHATIPGIRLAFRSDARADAAASKLGPSFRIGSSLIYLFAPGEAVDSLLDILQEQDDDDAYAADDMLLPYGNVDLAEPITPKTEFRVFGVDEFEEVFFQNVGTSPISIEEALATGLPFFDATVTGELVPGVLDQPFIGSVLRSHKDWQAANVFTDVRGLYRHIAEHLVSDKKEGLGITACHLAKDEESGKPRRKKRNVESNGAFMFDFDGEQTTDVILGKFEKLRCTFAAYSSYNHLKTPGVHKLRVILPFDRPFIPDEHGDRENYGAAVFRASLDTFAEKNGLELDRNARDVTRFMNSPRHPKGGTFFSRIHLGPLYGMEVVLPEERPVAKLARKAGVTLSYDVNGEAYVADGTGVDFFLSLIGDGPGQLGFHNPIYRVFCSYFSPSNEGPEANAAPIVCKLRETIEKAVTGEARLKSDINRYLSDAYLSAEVENARKFVRKRLEAKKVEEKADGDHMGALVAGYREEPSPEKLEQICRELAEIGRASLTACCRDGLAKKETGKADVARGTFDSVMKQFSAEAKKKQDAARKRALFASAKKPLIILSEAGFEEQCSTVAGGINVRNDVDPFFFITDRVQKRIVFDNGVPVLEPLEWVKFKYECNASVTVYGDAEDELDTSLPEDVTSHLYGSPERYGVSLERLLRHPVHARDGKLSVENGYDPETKCYFDLRGLQLPPVPIEPTEEEVKKAVSRLLDHLLVDFPFSDGFGGVMIDENGNAVQDTGIGSRAHAVAMILQPFVRGLFDGPAPVYFIDKPKAGTGATLLAELAYMISAGEGIPVQTLPDENTEVRKTLTSGLLSGQDDFFFDNVENKIEFEALLAFATGTVHRDRVLGRSEMATLQIRCRTMMTGNNMRPGEQMARRVLPIYMNARTDRPATRTGFKHKRIKELVRRCRAAFVHSCLVIIANWFAKGKPTFNDLAFGSYEEYGRVMGGILKAAGISGFLTNRRGFDEAKRGDEDDVASFMQALLNGMDDAKRNDGFDKHYAYDIAFSNEVLQYDTLKIGKVVGEAAQRSALANYLSGKLLGTYRLNKADGKEALFELVRAQRKKDGARWRLIEVPETTFSVLRVRGEGR